MDYILMAEFALCRINISKAARDFLRGWQRSALLAGLTSY